MTSSPLNDLVAAQYQRWIYPEPIEDLTLWSESNWQWFDPSHSHRMFWPNQGEPGQLSILVAGCGANQAAALALTNPNAHVIGIDVSEPSLQHQRWLKQRHELNNLELIQLPIEAASTLQHTFDLIVCTGVLHHLADPLLGLRSLACCLKRDGVIAIMLYARYGRYGVELMQSLFRDLGLTQDPASLFTVKEAIALLPDDHPVMEYIAMAPDLQFDAGLVDTFLHGRDRSYTVGDCLDLVDNADLAFVDWYFKTPYYAPVPAAGAFHQRIGQLPLRQQWAQMERIHARNACHFFIACHRQRPLNTYCINWDHTSAQQYVPCLRHQCGFDAERVYGPDWSAPLSDQERAVLELVDGQRTIDQILMLLNQAGVERRLDVFHSLWQSDILTMGLGS